MFTRLFYQTKTCIAGFFIIKTKTLKTFNGEELTKTPCFDIDCTTIRGATAMTPSPN